MNSKCCQSFKKNRCTRFQEHWEKRRQSIIIKCLGSKIFTALTAQLQFVFF